MISYYFLQKKYISFIAIICLCYMQYTLAYNFEQFQYKPPILADDYYHDKNQLTTIYAESDTTEIHYPKKIQLFGNTYIKYQNHIITSDILTILNNDNNHISDITIYADGNVHYYNKNITLIGSKAKFNLNNKNIDIQQGTYYFHKFHIYGTGTYIMQRKNNFYTIVKNSNLTSCKFCNNYWNIIGSEMLYDWNKNNIHIWNAYLKIKKIPIFYSPYLSLPVNQKNILKSYIPIIKYNNKYGFILKIPFPLIFSENYIGNITPYYTVNFGIGLQTKINYFFEPTTGMINVDIIENNRNNNHDNIFYKIYWKHHGIINNKWNLDIDYINHNNIINYNFNKINKKDFHNIYNYINQKVFCYYQNKHWTTSIAYLGNSNLYKKNITQKYCIYSATPQIEIQFHSNPIWKKNVYFQTFSQLSHFTPSHYTYPETTRIHIEPIINVTINNYWGRFNVNAKLYMTHYQQNNIHSYNIKQHTQYHLQNKINRIIPQFQTNGTIFFQKKTNLITSKTYFIESKLQYLYIPYIFQENIGIYDTKTIYINHNNLFHGTKYSGLDRIQSANQFTGNITIHCSNQQSELFYLSIGQILSFDQNHNFINNAKNIKYYLYQSDIYYNIKLLSLGTGSWNIKNYWNIRAEIQYDTLLNQLYSGNATLEYIGKNKQIFQSNYRYINTQLFQKNLISLNHSMYYKTIAQLGIIVYYPITTNWTINYSYYHNMQSNTLIDQTIGIQYSTPCYTFNIIFERNITDWNDKLHINSYENMIRFYFNFKSHSQLNSYKFLNSNIIPYHRLG